MQKKEARHGFGKSDMSKSITGTFEPEKPPKGWKKFYGDFVMEPDGTIFLPWVLAGCSEMEVFLCASYDGQPVMQLGKNAFYRANWLKDNFPKMHAAIDRAVGTIQKAKQERIGPFSMAASDQGETKIHETDY
jgi:hypothetical protein